MTDLRGPNNTQVGQIETKIIAGTFAFCLLGAIVIVLALVI